MKLSQGQVHLLKRLTDPEAPPRIVIHAAVGSGVGRVVTQLLAQDEMGTALILTGSRLLSEQWGRWLQEEAGRQVTELGGAAAALELIERGASRPGDVITVPFDVLESSLTIKALLGRHFDVVVIDNPIEWLGRFLGTPLWDAGKVIVLQTAAVLGPWSDWPSLTTTVPRMESDPAHIADVNFFLETEETDLFATASAFTMNNPTKRWNDGAETRPSLHQRLLRIVSTQSTDPGPAIDQQLDATTETAWTLLDRLEGMGPDPRLEALDRALSEAGRGQLTVVTTASLANLEYVAGHLAEIGTERLQIWSRGDPMLPSGPGVASPRELLLATDSIYREVEEWPEDVRIVWWTRPSSAEQVLDALIVAAPRVRVWRLRTVRRLQAPTD
jgi:hypothetical protein